MRMVNRSIIFRKNPSPQPPVVRDGAPQAQARRAAQDRFREPDAELFPGAGRFEPTPTPPLLLELALAPELELALAFASDSDSGSGSVTSSGGGAGASIIL